MSETKDTAQHVTDMRDTEGNLVAELVLRADPLADHHVKLWALTNVHSTLLGYVVDDQTLMPAYREDRVIWANDPLFVTKARQMYHRTF